MLRKVGKIFILTVALAMIFPVVSGAKVAAQAGDLSAQAGRIFPAWFFRSHSSKDKELWGNRGIAPRGYIVGGAPTETVATTEGTVEGTAEATTTAEEGLVTDHTVVKGECLWYIAGYKNIYGDPTQWPLIYRANKDKIKNPDIIYPGQVLRIPR